MREHLTQTFHGKAQQKEHLTWAGAERQAEVSAGAGGPYLVFCKRSRDHGALRTRTGSAQRWSDPGLTPPCGQPGRAPPPRSILGAGVGVGGGPGVSEGSQEQEAWSGDWRPDWEPEAALCSHLAGLLSPRGGGRGARDLPQFTPWAYPPLTVLLSSPFSSSF